MSALGRWWGSSRHGTQGGTVGDDPAAGPDTEGLPLGRRRRRFAWGSAHDVDLAPARPVPGEAPAGGADGTGATAGDSRVAAGPGDGRSQVPVADLLAAHPPTPPYGTPFDHDAVGGRAVAGPPGGVSAPPWRRPVTPPWGAPSETDDTPATTVTIGGIGAGSTPVGDSPVSTAGAAGSGPDMSTSSPEAGTAGTSRTTLDDPRRHEAVRTDAVVTPTGGDGTVDPVSDTSAGDPAATPEAVTATLAASTPGAGPTTPAVPEAPAEPTVEATAEPEAPAAPVTAAPAAPEPEPASEPARRPRHAAAPGPDTGPHADADVIDRHRLAQGRIGIDDVTPEVSGGRFPSKAVVGEVVPVGATVWREGHDAVAATVVWRRRPGATAADVASLPDPAPADEADADARQARMTAVGRDTDRFAGTLVADAEGLWTFHVEAWSDPWATWRHAVEVKAGAGQSAAELANDLETGARLLERGAAGIEDRVGTPAPPEADGTADITAPIPMPPSVAQATTCREAASALRDTDRSLSERLARALSEPVHRTMTEHPVRDLVVRSAPHHVVVERAVALAGSWYEFFPRSTGGRDAEGRPVHGTFATAARELERVAAMGFDVAYLPPIHPVGTVNRKGRNNTLDPGPDDVGSPWAIGSAAGGHDAVDPNLGTIDDFDAFVARAHDLGLEVALDLALQCAPDHPWAAAHPEWFVVRPDGTIAYAENPPKRYQDIYPVNFDTDPDGIYAEVLRVVLYWMAHGVRVFRVDNPHTKPPDFWSWLIAEVHRRDPGVVFLAEAFTRPARLFGLAKAGFSQSYTYFTWRTGKQELEEFFELHRDRIDEARPNCFVNTPDILHESLQVGGPGMFALRAALAATLSPTWGVYSGFELFEYQPVRAGSEEYLDSEKYELRPRDFAGALAEGRSLEPWLTRLNTIRRAHPALRQIRTLRFHAIDNDALLAFSKVDPVSGDTVVCVITLNPFGAEDGTLRLDLPALGLAPYERFEARDEVSGQVFDWGAENYVRLEPWRDVAHVVSVRRR